ncbi:Gene transfer agent (GTA) orfg15, like protein [Neorhizobium galegae bv. officinalis bv. officinalis str. HAMBI 1141]|uniref:Gene transfer agent (GTA) orfg15, like protein n=1 Tax=Neorhizobium galegae bv. officinalis bv. officinalis str. HAMBI 1141 TaxID=1028801 RepID=A0A068T421_NEOGA|nr:glycoside hydrolase/phage tail family protein [Neorhizobium galegae]CDN53228.1 Gene transfer agent (GTA) orfg15, like protein [Neorhizobium galegae bv. officinalis bv. officinalis str. HAMBI 1141]
MATILFQAAGAALGSVFGPVGAIIGRAAGALAGSMVDRALIGGSGTTISGPRLATARIPGADEGTAINRIYGTARIGGTLIWATRFEEEVTRERSGGKATSGPRVETFRYFANLAVGLCEGPIAGVRRVWADGRELDLTAIEMRVYRGDGEQLPDPLIEAKQGEGNAPAYRGLAYVVFDRLPLDSFGNRIPLLQFEVLRPVGRLEHQIRAVTVTPGATEHGYATVPVTEKTGEGSGRILNRHTLAAGTDWQASLDELQALCPNLERVALVVSWFGTDLRAGHCRIVPGVEVPERREESAEWSVAGMSRGDAHLVSQDGGPAFGGTPSDASVAQAITDLRARGLKVYLYPFVMMDIPPGNGLPDPYRGVEQAAFPWRGRITCFPASADKTEEARAQAQAFSAGSEGYRRMVLHYAGLAAATGGVDGFILGSELRGLTQLRDETGAFPFVQQLVGLAADVRAIVGPETKLTYGADWSEYFGYHPQDGSDEVHFHLDPLWASADIDAVGIDNYMPLGDWRDEDLVADNPDGFRLVDDVRAMAAQIAAGEGFDWYYASDADRRNRVRSLISDGLAGKPWVYRYKDLLGWWSNKHHDRVGGAENITPTAWVPGMKPIWFTELGCPAVDKGANQPNVFIDPKSAESALPYFSSGGRSDSMQRRFLEAHHGWWQGDATPAGVVDRDHVFVWTWDARPVPAFPGDLSAWSDGGNWRAGHWLNGRLGATTLADAIAAILTEHGFEDFDVSEVSGDLTGYVQGEVTSARALLEPLLEVFQVDVGEDSGRLRFRSRLKVSLAAKEITVVADTEDEALWSENRGHDSDFAAEAVLTSYNPRLDYEQSGVRSRRARAESQRILSYDLPAVLPEETSLDAVETLLRTHRIAKRSLSFGLSPADVAVEPGDAVRLVLPDGAGPDGTFIVERIEEGAVRRIDARHHAPLAPSNYAADEGHRNGGRAVSDAFAPILHFLDLPRFAPGEAASFARAAGFCRPWRRMALSSSVTMEGYRARAALDRPARLGVLAASLTGGIAGRFDRGRTIEIELFFGGLSSADEQAVLNGENRIAVKADSGVWEVIGFADAEEISPNRWRLSNLLRGLAGTEDAMRAGAASGNAVVVLDEAVVPLGLAADERGLALNWLAESLGQAGGRSGPHVFPGGVRAETPLSPVHVRGERQATGDVRLTWVRRGRIEADGWDSAEIPLDEPVEGYRLELLDGVSIKRAIEVAGPVFIYPAADEIADFGGPLASLSLRIRQMGRAVPLGVPFEKVVMF